MLCIDDPHRIHREPATSTSICIDAGAPAFYPAIAKPTGRTDFPKYPKAVARLRRQARRAVERERSRDIFMRLRDYAVDPDGEHIWLLLDPKPEPEPGETIH